MHPLSKFLNSLSTDEQKQFAVKCGTSAGYLRKAISKKQSLGAELCVRIEKHSNGAVTRRDLHPATYHLIWPELVNGTKRKPL